MRKLLLLSITALSLAAGSVWAASEGPQPAPEVKPTEHAGPKGKMHAWTLEEARKHAHEHADMLDKMTEAEWAEHQKKWEKHHEFREKLHNMSPEERDEFFKKMHEKHKHDKDANAAPKTDSAPPAAASDDKK